MKLLLTQFERGFVLDEAFVWRRAGWLESRIRKKTAIFLFLGSLGMVGCRYGGPPDGPVARRLSWFNYVGAENLRDACRPGTANGIRFVYNGIYDEQIRSYDVSELSGTRGAAFVVFARGDGDLTQGIRITNLLKPRRGERLNSVISPQSLGDLRAAFKSDRFTGFKPIGLRLSSRELYWDVAGCLDGRLHANNWMYPSQRFKSLKFHRILLENDKTAVAFNKAVPVDPHDHGPEKHEGGRNPNNGEFEIQLGSNGTIGARRQF